MRATTLLNRVLALPGVRVTGVDPDALAGDGPLQVTLALTRRLLVCAHCDFSTRHRYDQRDTDSLWRHLDLAGRICWLRLRRRRLACPRHGVVTEGVPFARPATGFTRDFEDLVVWLTTRSDKSTVATFARVAWRTVGATCERRALATPQRWRQRDSSGDEPEFRAAAWVYKQTARGRRTMQRTIEIDDRQARELASAFGGRPRRAR